MKLTYEDYLRIPYDGKKKKKSIRLYRRIDDRLTSVDVPDPLTTPLLPDFELRIKTLFV
jgi:hypothetical protein